MFDFITKAEKVHNKTYDYSQFIYINAKTKGKIGCKIHGVFEQTPDNHLHTKGCPACGNIKKTLTQRRTKEMFVAKAITIHGGVFDYSLFNYKGAHAKGNILCKIHGTFLQSPAKHLYGRGCPQCGDIQSTNLRRLTTAEFIEKSKIVHGDLYDYSKFEYIDAKPKD